MLSEHPKWTMNNELKLVLTFSIYRTHVGFLYLLYIYCIHYIYCIGFITELD